MLERLAELRVKDAQIAKALRVSERTVLRWWIGRPMPAGKRCELAACLRLVALVGRPPNVEHMTGN